MAQQLHLGVIISVWMDEETMDTPELAIRGASLLGALPVLVAL